MLADGPAAKAGASEQAGASAAMEEACEQGVFEACEESARIWAAFNGCGEEVKLESSATGNRDSRIELCRNETCGSLPEN